MTDHTDVKQTPEMQELAPQASAETSSRLPATDYRTTTRPRTDIRETDTGFVLQADMPGVDQHSTEVTVEKNVLTITGKAEPFHPEGFEPVYRESEPRYYERIFRLPEDVDPAELQATVRNGVLTLTIPKSKAAQPYRVQINGG